MSDFDRVVHELKAGRAVVFPTDTVYGLGVAVEYAASPQVIYDLKRRDGGKPIAWLVGGAGDLERYGQDVPAEALALAERHWPGALTLVVRASQAVPRAFAPDGTIGLRMPASDTALSLIHEVGPIAASSANRSGDKPARSFSDIDEGLLRETGAFLQGDVCASGVASTVLDVTSSIVRVLRQGEVVL